MKNLLLLLALALWMLPQASATDDPDPSPTGYGCSEIEWLSQPSGNGCANCFSTSAEGDINCAWRGQGSFFPEYNGGVCFTGGPLEECTYTTETFPVMNDFICRRRACSIPGDGRFECYWDVAGSGAPTIQVCTPA